MKIAHIVCSYPPYYGGMGTVALETVRVLLERGHEVEVITPFYGQFPEREEQYEPEIKEQIDLAKRITPTLQYGNAARMPNLERELETYDLVHLHYPFFGTAGAVRKWKLKHPDVPFVVTYHMDTRAGGWKGLIFKLYAKYYLPKMLDVADCILASSFDYIESSDARIHYLEHKEKWRELPFGVDTNRFAPREKPVDLFLKHLLDPTLPTLLFVGGMDAPHYFKGITVLLKAFAELQRQGVSVQLMLVGDGELRTQYEMQAKVLGIEKSIRFVGRVSHEELPSYYNAADAVVLPSIHQGEAFGMVLLEAMASGVPVIASELPGVRTVVMHGGYTVPKNDPQALADQIAAYVSDSSLKKTLGTRAREAVLKQYAWKSIGKSLETVYNTLVAH